MPFIEVITLLITGDSGHLSKVPLVIPKTSGFGSPSRSQVPRGWSSTSQEEGGQEGLGKAEKKRQVNGYPAEQ